MGSRVQSLSCYIPLILHLFKHVWPPDLLPLILGVLHKIYGYHFGGARNKDYSISGSILGSPLYGNSHCKTTLPLILNVLSYCPFERKGPSQASDDFSCEKGVGTYNTLNPTPYILHPKP